MTIPLKASDGFIYIQGKSQTLHFLHLKKQLSFHISTAKNGFGEEKDSFKTPRGWHYIRFIIGKKQPTDAFFMSRKVCEHSDISGRILWLTGLSPAQNKGGKVDSFKRYIYIHGTPNKFLKTPISKGCINMQNSDIAKLTSLLPKYCKVYIDES